MEPNCQQTRILIGPNLRPGGDPDHDRAVKHVSSCVDCQTFYSQSQRLAERVRAAAFATTAPAALGHRIRRALDEEATSVIPILRRRSPIVGAIIAAAAAVAIVVAAPWSDARNADLFPIQHQALQFTSLTHADVSQWLSDRMGHEVTLPTLAQAAVRGAVVEHVEGAMSARVDYEVGETGTVMSYVMGPMTDDMKNVKAGPDGMKTVRLKGSNAIMWEMKGEARAVVADMPIDELHKLAMDCRGQEAQF